MGDDSSFTCLLDDSFNFDDSRNVDGQLSRLKDALRNLDQEFEAVSCRQILQDCLAGCPYKSLEEQVFREIFPAVRCFLLETVKEISERIKTSCDQGTVVVYVNRKLTTCHELLELWQTCLEHVSKLRNVLANDVQSVLDNVPDTIRAVFEHCKASPKLYGSSFTEVSGGLKIFCQRAKAVLTLFLATLQDVIVFDTGTETELLVKVINLIGAVAIVANGLDLKTFVETFKAFGKLAIIHQQAVKRVSSTSVTLHLEQIVRDVSTTISTFQDSRKAIEEKTVKVAGHLLKIFDKLFTAYGSSLNNEVLLSVVELLLQMHRCSPCCLQVFGIDVKTINQINVGISLGCEPLLNTVFKCTDFKEAYFEYGARVDVDKLGYHLLTLGIMKKLIGMPYEHNCKWTLGAESIIDVAIANINSLQEELCAGEIKVSGAHDIGERPRNASLYEATLVPICSLIGQVPAEGFHAVELLLLKHLLGGQFWPALLSCDIWCFVGRLGSSDLCASHVKYFLNVHAALAKRRTSFQTVVLESLIGRLYALLPEETKHSLVLDLDDTQWRPIARFLTPRTTSFLQKRLSCTLNEIPKVFADLQRQPTVKNWNRLTTLISLAGELRRPAEKETVDCLLEMWNSIASTIEDFEGRQLDILSDFGGVLLSGSRPENVQDESFVTILDAILTSSLCFPPHLTVALAHYLCDNVNSFGQNAASALSELNCRLLEDENPWVRQEALESFDYVAHTCPNEDLVTRMAAAVAKKPTISRLVPAYLSGASFYDLRDFPSVQQYLRHLGRTCKDAGHVCCRYDDSQRDKCARMETESGADDPTCGELERRLNELCDELADILERRDDISAHGLRRVRSVCEKYFCEEEK